MVRRSPSPACQFTRSPETHLHLRAKLRQVHSSGVKLVAGVLQVGRRLLQRVLELYQPRSLLALRLELLLSSAELGLELRYPRVVDRRGIAGAGRAEGRVLLVRLLQVDLEVLDLALLGLDLADGGVEFALDLARVVVGLLRAGGVELSLEGRDLGFEPRCSPLVVGSGGQALDLLRLLLEFSCLLLKLARLGFDLSTLLLHSRLEGGELLGCVGKLALELFDLGARLVSAERLDFVPEILVLALELVDLAGGALFERHPLVDGLVALAPEVCYLLLGLRKLGRPRIECLAEIGELELVGCR